MIINLISGPRNISTALMYAFAQHSKIKVIDEPFYAYYLVKTGLNHPGRDETIASMSSDPIEVIDQIHSLEKGNEIVFLKNMAHHHEGLDWSYLKDIHNIFLIRDPKQLIASFAQVITNPTIQDIGLKHEADLLDYVQENCTHPPIVIDSNDILKDPEKSLSKICRQLNISFQKQMLTWEKGTKSEDGVWAKYWYKNVHNSTGFTKQKTSDRSLPEHCKSLHSEAISYYEKLKAHATEVQP
ncbi:sulfotransferase family protein [Ekhidna sp.]|uniref:sulfotransferase-like domain-containing protein n=1 Tax=Ekhidna sp. TaxID=2608089 RepID=UPI00329A00DE